MPVFRADDLPGYDFKEDKERAEAARSDPSIPADPLTGADYPPEEDFDYLGPDPNDPEGGEKWGPLPANTPTTEELVETVAYYIRIVAEEDAHRDGLTALATLSERLEAATRDGDPDYSPEYQDEYQRLWHEAAERLEAAERELVKADGNGVRLLREKQAAEAERDRLRVWIASDVARARGLAQSMTELGPSVRLEGVEENCSEIVRLLTEGAAT